MKAEIYKVGGAVRDALLNRPVSETDWVVVGSTPQAMLDAGYKQVGKDFPVFLHPKTNEEYALARTERKRGRGYHGFEIDAAPDVTLEEDLKRRDLTVNAMAMDETGNLIDPYGGQQDLDNRLLRHVSSAFAEDPLRVLRTARFAARYHYLGFAIAEETLALMRELSESGELQYLAKERVWLEIQKGLNEASPHILLTALLDCQALHQLFPDWADSLNETLLSALARAEDCKLDSETRFALACANLSLTGTKQLCKTLTVPKNHTHLAQLYQRVQPLLEQADSNAGRLLDTLEKSDALRRPELIEQLCALQHCRTGRDYQHYLQAAEAMRSVNSRDLIDQGYSGVALGEALREARLKKIQEQL